MHFFIFYLTFIWHKTVTFCHISATITTNSRFLSKLSKLDKRKPNTRNKKERHTERSTTNEKQTEIAEDSNHLNCTHFCENVGHNTVFSWIGCFFGYCRYRFEWFLLNNMKKITFHWEAGSPILSSQDPIEAAVPKLSLGLPAWATVASGISSGEGDIHPPPSPRKAMDPVMELLHSLPAVLLG